VWTRGNGRYGTHVFGKIRLAEVDDAFIHVRLFVNGEEVKFHAIRVDEVHEPKGKTKFVAIFTDKDTLEWFDA
jgi:hypothetical protein